MSSKKEDLGKNTFKITVEVEAKEFEDAIEKSYNKNKKKFKINGFRPGTAPKDLIIKMYGEEVFYDDAINMVLGPTYEAAIDEQGIVPVAMPKIDVVECGHGKNLVYTAEVAVKPEVTLGKYKGVKVAEDKVEITDEDVENEIKANAEKNARLVSIDDRASKNGDILNIDFVGSIDGVEFEGGAAKAFDLTLGSKSFIDNFEEQLEGKNVGDEVVVKVKFPKDYGKEDLQGKKAEFKVKVNSITERVMPEINDEFAQDASEFDTLAEYKEDLKKKLVEKSENEAKQARRAKVLEAVAAESTMEIPEAMIEGQVNAMINNFARQLQMQGMNFEDFMKYSGMNMDTMKEQYKEGAEKDIRVALTLEAVAKAENIEASEEDVNKELSTMADKMKKPVDEIKKLLGARMDELKEELSMEKTIDFLVENSKK